MPPIRHCIERGCTAYTTKTRCAQHEREYQRRRKTPSQAVGQSAAGKRRRRAILRTGPPWTCHLCGKAILTAGDLEVDHRLPLGAGGAHDDANTAAAHVTCNRSRKWPRKPRPGHDPTLPPWKRYP